MQRPQTPIHSRPDPVGAVREPPPRTVAKAIDRFPPRSSVMPDLIRHPAAGSAGKWKHRIWIPACAWTCFAGITESYVNSAANPRPCPHPSGIDSKVRLSGE